MMGPVRLIGALAWTMLWGELAGILMGSDAISVVSMLCGVVSMGGGSAILLLGRH